MSPFPLLWRDTLRCPVTGQPLHPASEALVRELEIRRQTGTLSLPAANPQPDGSRPIHEALVREDSKIAYLIEEGIPVLLPDHGIPLE